MGNIPKNFRKIKRSLNKVMRTAQLIQIVAEKIENDYGRFDYPITTNLAELIKKLNKIICKID